MFGFITHFSKILDLEIYKDSINLLEKDKVCLPRENLKEILNILTESRVSLEITSEKGVMAPGIVKFLPYLAIDFCKNNENEIMNYIKNALKELKSQKIQLVGLGGFTSMLGDRGLTFSKEFNMAFTTGNTYTAALICKSILNLVESQNINKEKVSILVIGASGDIGSICVRYLAKFFNNFTLIARDKENLKQLFEDLILIKNIHFSSDLNKDLSDADIVISVSSSPIPLVDFGYLKSGTIFCDASYPQTVFNVNALEKANVLLYEGGKALMGNSSMVKNQIWQLSFPKGIIFGCLAETLILSLEKKIESFSIGRGLITENNLNLIYELGLKHGFKESPPKWNNFFYKKEYINSIMNILKLRVLEKNG